MPGSEILMWAGFLLASYAVVGNDSIQTLGTFLNSNEKSKKWYVLWAFAAAILTGTLVYGWYVNSGDVSFARLDRYPLPEPFSWYYLLPPLVLMMITRMGIPVSTSFMVLTFFSPQNLDSMMFKSIMGYVVAFGAAFLLYISITSWVEKRFLKNKITNNNKKLWTVLQWCATGFLWSQWLIQDFANIYAYLPRQLSFIELIISLIIILSMLAYIFYSKGGKIQKIVKSKINTADIRSATIVDFTYALVLLYFKEMNNIPMSTTWVFIGLLAGRELAMRVRLNTLSRSVWKNVGGDLAKVSLGLIVSVVLVFLIRWMSDGMVNVPFIGLIGR